MSHTLRMSSIARLAIAPFALCLIVGVAGCGSSSSGSSSSGSSSSGGSGASTANVKHANTVVAQYTALPAFTSPGPAFDAKKAAGKVIFSLPSNSTIPFVETTDASMRQLAGTVGIQYQTYPNQGKTSQYVQGMTTAISRKVNLINLLDGTDPRLIAPQISQAKAAGIPVVDSHDLDLSQQPYPNVAAFVDMDAVQAGKIVAASAISQTKGDADVLIITSNNYANSQPTATGLKQEFAQDMPLLQADLRECERTRLGDQDPATCLCRTYARSKSQFRGSGVRQHA